MPDPDVMHDDCRWCSMCGLPVMDGIFITGYCQLTDLHDGDCTLHPETDE